MNLYKQLLNLSKNKNAKIVLAEAHIDNRVKKALEIIIKKKLCQVIIFESKNYSKKIRQSQFVQIVDMENFENSQQMANRLCEIRKHKNLTLSQAKKLLKSPVYFGTMLIEMGYAKGMICGAAFSTADSLRPALQIFKTANGQPVSGNIILIKDNFKPLIFADAALIENPTPEQLVIIAQNSAKLMQSIFDVRPKVAMLSYSSWGSADSENVKKMQTATKLANKLNNLEVDGEMQFDTAISPAVAMQKGKKSTVAGQANVFVFPDLNSANIGYKIAKHLGNYVAIGPITANLSHAVNDLSRGCTVKEILLTLAITKLQSEMREI